MLLLDAELANGPFAAREARRKIAGIGAALPQQVVSDVTLLVSELVTNSYRHGGLPKSDAIRLRVLSEGGTIRIEVADGGRAGRPEVREPDVDGGWGLRIVEELADRWGADRGAAGTTVWFELEAM